MQLFVFASVAMAGQLTPTGKILSTYTSSGWTMLQIENHSTNTFGCTKAHWYAINLSNPNYQGLLSSILAAQMAGKTVSFWVQGCGGKANEYSSIESITVNS